MTCAGDNTIAALLAGAIDAEAARRLEDHLDRCPACRALVADLGRGLSAIDGAIGGAREGSPNSGPLPQQGDLIGRYRVRRVIGVGGMGVVYEAHDTSLDRRIAVKLLRPDVRDLRDGDHTPLLDEARSMARLSHPNIATVHDVGVARGQVYVCMEYIAGATLREWIAGAPRSWRQIVEIMIAAGRGLSYVHRAGLVHLDFKPDNVLVDRSGRAVVTDFGLARIAGTDARETRVIAGTPAYMAPEQRRGAHCDARADQYAFGAALRESLAGAVTAPPAWLDRVVARALADAPEDRFPSQDALLAKLQAGLHRVRRRALAVAAVVVAGLATAAAQPVIHTQIIERAVERASEPVIERSAPLASAGDTTPAGETCALEPIAKHPIAPAAPVALAALATHPAPSGLAARATNWSLVSFGVPSALSATASYSAGPAPPPVPLAASCDDNSALTCTADPPACPGDAIAALRDGCWTCADPDHCQPLGIARSCDDGTPLRCAAPRPICTGYSVAAIRGGCWTCADPFTCITQSSLGAMLPPAPFVPRADPQCGNARCEAGEDRISCAADCCESGASGCVAECGNGTCERGETHASCASDCCQLGPGNTCVAECGNSICERGETHASCASDCCQLGPGNTCVTTCGDGLCGIDEQLSCMLDCRPCINGGCATCGNGMCEVGEDNATCERDCPARCGNEPCAASCGDGLCTIDETAASCPRDCSLSCGNRACEPGEDASSCPADCMDNCPNGGCGICGNRLCEAGESSATCPSDCGKPQTPL